jgi:hypothetical protein
VRQVGHYPELFNCVYGFFIDAMGFCDDVTQGYGRFSQPQNNSLIQVLYNQNNL